MSSGLDLREYGWNGDGENGNGHQAELLASTPGIVQEPNGELHFSQWNCRAGQNNVIIRTDGTVAPCFPMYGATFDWGNIDQPKFDQGQLTAMKSTCQRHCSQLSTITWRTATTTPGDQVVVDQRQNRFQGGVRSFED